MLALVVRAHRFEHHAADGQHAPAVERVVQPFFHDTQLDPFVAPVADRRRALELLIHLAAARQAPRSSAGDRPARASATWASAASRFLRPDSQPVSRSSVAESGSAVPISSASCPRSTRSRSASACAAARRRNSCSSTVAAACNSRRRRRARRLGLARQAGLARAHLRDLPFELVALSDAWLGASLSSRRQWRSRSSGRVGLRGNADLGRQLGDAPGHRVHSPRRRASSSRLFCQRLPAVRSACSCWRAYSRNSRGLALARQAVCASNRRQSLWAGGTRAASAPACSSADCGIVLGRFVLRARGAPGLPARPAIFRPFAAAPPAVRRPGQSFVERVAFGRGLRDLLAEQLRLFLAGVEPPDGHAPCRT